MMTSLIWRRCGRTPEVRSGRGVAVWSAAVSAVWYDVQRHPGVLLWAVEDEVGSVKIYASPYGGKRYHDSPHCVGLNSSAMSMLWSRDVPTVTRAEAERRGLTPCKVCQPPPLLRAVS